MTALTPENEEKRVVAEVPVTQLRIAPPTAPAVAPAAAPVAAAQSKPNILAVARGRLTSVVPYLQHHLARIGPAGQAGLAALAAAAVVIASAVIPARNAIRELSSDILHAQHAPQAASGPTDGIAGVVTSLPTREQIPAVLGKVFQQAQDAGVQLDNGTYAFVPAKAGAVARYEIQFPVKASYPQIRNFINGTLTAVSAAGLSKLHVERKTVGETTVHADVNFVIFVRGG
jgi:hypothetical protein